MLDLHHAILDLHRTMLDLHRAMLDLHRTMLDLHRDTLAHIQTSPGLVNGGIGLTGEAISRNFVYQFYCQVRIQDRFQYSWQ